eukprot:GGOE01046861.1.p4 GENE.GGOE01046861.1~~GGOE01046861.1.p4  ORF type:complete len:176 (-),score=27.83 GGOE01046861.1:523-1050(-)
MVPGGGWRLKTPAMMGAPLSQVRARFFSRHAALHGAPVKGRTLGERVREWRHDLGTMGLAVVAMGAVLVVVVVLEVVVPTLTRVVPTRVLPDHLCPARPTDPGASGGANGWKPSFAVVGFFGAILIGISTVFNYIMRGGKRKELTKDLERGNVTSIKAPPPTPSGASAAPAQQWG